MTKVHNILAEIIGACNFGFVGYSKLQSQTTRFSLIQKRCNDGGLERFRENIRWTYGHNMVQIPERSLSCIKKLETLQNIGNQSICPIMNFAIMHYAIAFKQCYNFDSNSQK